KHPYSCELMHAEPEGEALPRDEREEVLQVQDLHVSFPLGGGLFRRKEYLRAVDGISLSIQRGKTLGIVGESGSGKSTLARIIALIDPASGGELKIEGKPVDIARRRPDTQMRSKVQMVFQNPYGSLNPRQKVGVVLMEPLVINTKIPASERRERAEAMLVKVGLGPEHFNRYPHMFSGGQRQRIAIARALMLNPALLVLDEPVSALDLSVQAQVLNLLRDLQEEFELTYVFVSHDLSVVRYIADDVMVISKGVAVEQGTREELFADPKHPYTRQLFAATPITDVDAIRARVERRKAARLGATA
ncbi:ABC transporter ATP-binding protein, partial [Pseudomonas aeruginosa]